MKYLPVIDIIDIIYKMCILADPSIPYQINLLHAMIHDGD